MIINKDKFKNEHQFDIAKEELDKAFIKKYGKDDELLNDIRAYEEFIDQILYESDESAFHGTDEEIKKIWSNPNIFE